LSCAIPSAGRATSTAALRFGDQMADETAAGSAAGAGWAIVLHATAANPVMNMTRTPAGALSSAEPAQRGITTSASSKS
jgi:hypothetical protein